MVESLAVAIRLGFLKQSPNALASNEASITDAHEASIFNAMNYLKLQSVYMALVTP